MCRYVTAVLPPSAAIPAIGAIMQAHGRALRPVSNPRLSAQAGAGARVFLTTAGHCDCDTPLGALADAARRAPDWAAEETRLARKGWSRGKVARALRSMRDDFDASLQASAAANRNAILPWLDLVRAVLASGSTPHLDLLLHGFSGPLDAPVELAGRQTVRPTELTGELLGQMQEDVLYRFLA
ncbi:MAG: hypothetical protein ACTHKZ_02180 [Lysobacteraceae bacterium]